MSRGERTLGTEMIGALALSVIATAGGVLASYWYEDDAPPGWRICAGAVTGLTALGLAGLAFSLATGLGPGALLLAGVAAGSPIALLLRRAVRLRGREELSRASQAAIAALRGSVAVTSVRLALLIAAFAILWRVNARVIFERVDGLYTGVTNNIGDLPFHLAVVTRFLHQGNLPPENPTFAGTHFTYPILADFVAAMFMEAGAGLRASLVGVNLVLMCALVGLLYRWALRLTSDNVAAAVTPALVMLSGGLGWWVLVSDVASSQAGVLGTIANLPHDYTIMDGNWRWGNMITALLLPQRAFLFGLPLSILVFTLWTRAFEAAAVDGSGGVVPARRRMAAAGVLAGMMPVAHTHSYAVVMAVAACFAIGSRRVRAWLPFFAGALALSVPQIVWLASGGSVDTSRFIAWQFGWDRGSENAVWFWLKNTGALIPLLLVAAFWRGTNAPVPARLLRLYLPFVALFVVPNVLRLSPWIWDNIKFLIYWHVASAPLVALVLARLWRARQAAALGSAVLMIVLTAAGTLDVWRVASAASEHRVFSREGMAFADLVRHIVPPNDLILHAPTYNHPVFLAGRRSFMGYPGHVWSHGLPLDREADIQRIYAGADDAERLLGSHGIAYVVLGPLERELLKVNDAFFTRFDIVGRLGPYALCRVASVTRGSGSSGPIR